MESQGELTSTNKDEINLLQIFQILWKRRWLVVWITAGFTVAGIGAAFVWPKSYEATATVFPIANASSSNMSDYAGLAALAGVSLPSGGGGNNAGKTVNALLGSRLLVENLVDDLDLLEKFPKIKGKTPELRKRSLVDFLRKKLKTKEDVKTGVISVTVELPDAELAQSITNQILSILDQLLVEKSFTTNRKKQEELERQIEEQGKKLNLYQQQMAKFQKQTSLLNPTAQSGKTFDAYTVMIQQKMDLELRLATAQASYSVDNPKIMSLKVQLQKLDSQIDSVKNQTSGDLPSLKMAPDNMIEFQNLTRDLEISTKIYAGLSANMEQTKLESDKDQVYIEVLDRALLPIEGKPSRGTIVMVAFALGFILSLVFSFSLHAIRQIAERYRGQS